MTPMAFLAQIARRLDAVQRSLEERARNDVVQDHLVSRLYEELDGYKRAAQDARMLDLARGVFLVLDKLDPDRAGGVPLDMVRDELLDCLAAVGIERIDGVPGTLDARHETVVGFLDESLPGGPVRRVVSDGYVLDDRVVRPRRVLIRRSAAA